MAKRRAYRRLNPAFVEACRAFVASRGASGLWCVKASFSTLLFNGRRDENQYGRCIVAAAGTALHERYQAIAALIGFDGDVLEEVQS